MDIDNAPPVAVLAEADEEDADSLVSTNEPDDMAGEQTWPTEEEMSHPVNQEDNNDKALPDASAGTTPKSIQKGKSSKIKRKSHGLGDYMASWIIESDEEDEDGDEENGDARPTEDDVDMNGIGNSEEPAQGGDEDEDMDEEMSLDASAAKSSGKRVAFEDLDEEEEAEQ